MDLFPPELSHVFLDEHSHLRKELDALEGLLMRVSEPAVADDLRRRVFGFSTQLLAHLEHEERLLRPLLADDVWGYQRVAVMDGDHAAQRARLAELEKQLTGGVERWGASLQRFIELLRADMASEDREIFAESAPPSVGRRVAKPRARALRAVRVADRR